MTRPGPGFVFVPALILALVLGFCMPVQALPEPCVTYADICVPGYVVKYLPPQPEYAALGPSEGPLLSPEMQVREIAAYFWPAWAVERMVRIAECETEPDWDPTSYNPSSGASGIWQIMPGWQRTWPGNYFDPWTNGAVAYQIWLVQGFDAWVCTG